MASTPSTWPCLARESRRRFRDGVVPAQVVKCDEFTLSYMEEHKFPQSDIGMLRVASENLVRLPYTCTEQDLQSVLSLTPQEAVTLARAARKHSGTDQGSHVSSEAVRRVLLGV